MEALSETVDVGAKADSLHDAADFDLHTLVHRLEACRFAHDCTAGGLRKLDEVVIYA